MKTSIIQLSETSSTNSYAVDLLSKTRPDEGIVIVADSQTGGRGMGSNSWESEKGENLTISVILYPAFKAEQQFILNKAISLAICHFLEHELPGSEISIKWPNDIYIGNKKVCGMLIQNSIIVDRFDYVVIGIGLNVNQVVFKSDAPNPVSLKMITGKHYNLSQLLKKLLSTIFANYALIKPDTIKNIEIQYHNSLYQLLEWQDYIVRGTKMQARITGTNTYGQLLLETEEQKELTCDLKEVRFIL